VDWATRAAHLTAPPDLLQGRYGNPLTLQLVALLRLLDPDLPLGQGPAPGRGGGAGAPERDLLTHHERKYWQHTAPQRLQPQVLDQAVTAATLCGAATPAEARALLVVLPGLSGQPENAVIAVGNWLRELYPAPPGQAWGALQPDRVGEHLVAATLTDDPRILPALLGAAGAAQRYQAVTVLARALANPTIAAELRDRLGVQLREVFTAGDAGTVLAGIALQVATETADPRPLIDTIAAGIPTLTTTGLEQLAWQLPERSLTLADLAADITTAWVHRLRGTPNDVAGLAKALNNQSNALAALRRREDALTASTEAVAIRRELAAARPDAFGPDLATALNNQSNRLAVLGRREDALSASTEAVQMYRELMEQHPVFRESLAVSLASLGIRLTELDDHYAALSAERKAVAIYTALFPSDPERYRDSLEQSVTNLVIHLRNLGYSEQEMADELDALSLPDVD
jgi:Tetratricopeptide repeat